MRYKYCPKCDQLRPRKLLMDDRCEGCQDGAVTILVPRSIYGKAMYVADIIAALMLVLYLAHRDLNAGFASFMASINSDLFLVLLFGLIIGSFVLAFIDLGRTNQEARRIVDERREHLHD
jgi:uncharacterized membrane protein (DUF485 family)